MVFLQKKQLLLRLLPLHVIVNDHLIYELSSRVPVVIEMPTNPARFVVSDGFHISRPFDVSYGKKNTLLLKVSSRVEDGQLIFGIALIVILFAMGATSGYFFLNAISLLPIGYFLYLYYGDRRKFIRILKA